MYKYVVIDSGDYVRNLKGLLATFVETPIQAYHEFMGVIIEAVRFRDRAVTEVVTMVKELDKNLTGQAVHCQADLVQLVREFSFYLLFQLETFKFYNERGVLMYTYYRHPDALYPDVMLTEILPLTWNGRLYEPHLSPAFSLSGGS